MEIWEDIWILKWENLTWLYQVSTHWRIKQLKRTVLWKKGSKRTYKECMREW